MSRMENRPITYRPNYSNTVIYKIQHLEKNELIYVGHTTNFKNRKSQHKGLVKCCKESREYIKTKLYRMIVDNGDWEAFNMVVLEEYPCYTKAQACKREDEIMRELKATMNKVMPKSC